MPADRQAVNADGAPAAVGPYSHAVAAGGLLFCSGQIALDPASGELIDGGVDRQATACLQNLAAVCEAAGARLEDAVRITVYATDLAGDWATINDVYASFFATSGADAGLPARAAVGVAALPKGAQVEIDAVVALPG